MTVEGIFAEQIASLCLNSAVNVLALESGRNYLARHCQAQTKSVLLDSAQFWSTQQLLCDAEMSGSASSSASVPGRELSRAGPFREAL